MTISRAVLNSLLPEGAFWTPAAQSDYDLLLEGIADNTEEVYQVLKSLACIRCPETTTLLDDLEKEYGIIPATLATEAERRSRLEAFIYRRAGTGAWDLLQSKLREAGFDDVYVHPNDPAVDPNIFLTQAFNMVCGDLLPGGNEAQCGEPEAICAQVGGELVVNGDLFKSVPNYINLAGEPGVECGDDVFCGDFDGYKSSLVDITYEIPADSGYWPLIFFVGGPAERRWRFLNEAVVNLPLKTDALDISGNGNDGVATDITWTGGVANFNGTTSKIDCGNSSTLNFENKSICIYVEITSLVNGVRQAIIDKSAFSSSNGGFSLEKTAGNNITFSFYDGSIPSPFITSSIAITDANKHSILVYFDKVNNIGRMYIDNALVGSKNLTGEIWINSSYNLTLGALASNGTFKFTGTMSNLYIFNRALTDMERMALYTDNAQTGGDGELSEIEFYNLPIQRRLEFRRTILKFKPMHSWGGLIVVYN